MQKGYCRGNSLAVFRCAAFTLAELLMAVLVISIIMIALAPVITRRAYDNVSIEVNKKKGLEIYTNPGTYTFDVPIGINTLFLQGSAGGGGGSGANYIDKSTTFSANTNWIVPQGVNEVTFTIIGSGGGGGGGYGKTMSDSCEANSRRIPYMADNGQDICVTTTYPKKNTGRYTVVNWGESCNEMGCCWANGPANMKHTTTCTYTAVANWCSGGKSMEPENNYPFKDNDWTGGIYNPRMLTVSEATRINGTKYMGSLGLDACWSPSSGNPPNPQSAYVPQCYWNTGCRGAAANNCMPDAFHLHDGYFYIYGDYRIYNNTLSNSKDSFTPICARNLNNWESFSGAGGQSAAMIQNKTIKVLPGDVLKITVGKGGVQGNAGGHGGNGSYSAIEHLRNGSRYKDPTNTQNTGYYYAYGGYGGYRATSTANGEVRNEVHQGCSHPSECKNAASSNSGKGYAGTRNSGGAGAGGTLGGTLDTGEGTNGTGYRGSQAGYGGGGGTCARGVQSPSSCSKGGAGADGSVSISYRIMIPGAGGGAGTNVGGLTTSGEAYELKYKVQEGSRIVFKVGAQGTGGVGAQDGLSGSATVIGNNEIIFLAGQGAKTLTNTQKTNLSNCIGVSTSSSVIANCIANVNYKAQSGYGSYINYDGNNKTSTNGLIISGSNVGYTIANANYKGRDGKQGGQKGTAIPWIYGFDGGVSGMPFGMLNSNNLTAAITCGGGIQGTLGTKENYICTSGARNGNDAKAHDPVNNEFGGSGGGGGGVVENSSALGQGGSGSSGYLRIRWDETEQE